MVTPGPVCLLTKLGLIQAHLQQFGESSTTPATTDLQHCLLHGLTNIEKQAHTWRAYTPSQTLP